ncbi:MAG: hypothetical protein SCALA701_23860 [Candidatus Scalindua sp.]|nr:MAG: hypothetical protein SCALA701_23860 [Candidatus Scalindua sp.]
MAVKDPSQFLADFPDGVVLDEIQKARDVRSIIQVQDLSRFEMFLKGSGKNNLSFYPEP